MKRKLTLINNIQYEILLLPALAAFILFFLIPLIKTFGYSFTDWDGYSRKFSIIGLENYFTIFKDPNLTISITNTILFAVSVTILQNVMALGLAVALDSKIASRKVLRTIYFMPSIFSMLIIGYLWSFILSSSDSGLLNYILRNIGLGFLTNNWLGDPGIALKSIIGVTIWQITGWAMVIYLANLQSIPEELLEAAVIDGAGGIKKFWYITFRMMAPSLTINSLVSMIGSLKVYDQVIALTGGGPGYSTETITTTIMSNAFKFSRFGLACSLAVFMFLVILVISAVMAKFLLKNEESVYNA